MRTLSLFIKSSTNPLMSRSPPSPLLPLTLSLPSVHLQSPSCSLVPFPTCSTLDLPLLSLNPSSLSLCLQTPYCPLAPSPIFSTYECNHYQCTNYRPSLFIVVIRHFALVPSLSMLLGCCHHSPYVFLVYCLSHPP